MAINGVSITQGEGYILCCVDEFSDDLKTLIREELSAICHGKSEVEEYGLVRHSYKRTLEQFLVLYDPKPDNTKKGIIGEFIAHLLINKVLPTFKAITILFNKEELSIKKGFDLTYIELKDGVIWYGEVKSGELSAAGADSPDKKNKELLDESKNGIREFLAGQRPNLWNNVIIDVGLSIAHKDRKKVKDLLDADIENIQNDVGAKNNVILISVLFHDAKNKVSEESLQEHLTKFTAEAAFENIIIFSIQKSTYSLIEEFLREEIQYQ